MSAKALEVLDEWTDEKGEDYVQIPTPTADLILIRPDSDKRELWEGKNVVEITSVRDAIDAIKEYGESHDDFSILVSDHGNAGIQMFGGAQPKAEEIRQPGGHLDMTGGVTRDLLHDFISTVSTAGVTSIEFCGCGVGAHTGSFADEFLPYIATSSGATISAYYTAVITQDGFWVHTPNGEPPALIIIRPKQKGGVK